MRERYRQQMELSRKGRGPSPEEAEVSRAFDVVNMPGRAARG